MKTGVKALTILAGAGLLSSALTGCAGAAPGVTAGGTTSTSATVAPVQPATGPSEQPATSPSVQPAADPRREIADGHFGPAGQVVVTTGANVTMLSTDAGHTWGPLAVPGQLPPGHSVEVHGAAIVAASLDTAGHLDVQRSGDGGKTWATQNLETPLDQPSQVNVATSDDSSTLAVAAMLPHSAGAEGMSDLFVGPAGKSLVKRTMPNDGSVYWVGKHLLAIGGALNSTLYVSDDQGVTWSQSTVGGVKVDPASPVPVGAPSIGEPVTLTGGRVAIPVTVYDGDSASIQVLATSDGRHFTTLGTLAAGTDVPPGLWAFGSTAGPGSAVFAMPSSTDFITVTGAKVTSITSTGLPGPVDSITFSDQEHGVASVTTNGCNSGKADCWTTTELYATTDGGHTWTLSAPPTS